MPAHVPRFDQRGQNERIFERQCEGLSRGSHAVAQNQTRIAQISKESFGKNRDLVRHRGAMQDHQINIAEGC